MKQKAGHQTHLTKDLKLSYQQWKWRAFVVWKMKSAALLAFAEIKQKDIVFSGS